MSFASSIIARFGKTYSLTRKVAATYVNGVVSPGSESTISILASVQPVTDKEKQLLTLSEGLRTSELRKLWTMTPIYTEENGYAPDVVTIDAKPWVVISVKEWSGISATPHFEALISRKVTP